MSDITKIKVDGEPESSYQLYPRNEEFAKRAGGNGGSQSVVQPDWNQNGETAADYVKNRPFYTGDPVETVLLEETTPKFANMGVGNIYGVSIPIDFSVERGQTYKVFWDGTVYECVCTNLSESLYFGNMHILTAAGIGAGFPDTGEPFLMASQNNSDSMALSVYTQDTSATHTISISGFAVSIIKIDEKYLPEHFVLYEGDPANWSEPKKRQMYDDFVSGKLLLYEIPTSNNKVGVVLSVFYANTVGLRFVLFDHNGALNRYDGNSFASVTLSEYGINSLIKDYVNELRSWKLFDYKDTGSELAVGDLIFMRVGFDSTTNKACISTQTKEAGGLTGLRNYTIVTNGDSDITLSSSTPDSTKKFKITVDDNGTLTATEVT